MIYSNLVEKIVNNNLCTSCGTCVGVCPVSCIEMDRNCEPQLSGECIDCGLCLEFCPAVLFDFMKFRKSNEKTEVNPFLGSYRSIYFGHTVDKEIRSRASGGGVVSALLISALEKGLIDGAVVVKMDNERVGQTKIAIAENRVEVLEAAQSKYIPGPVNTILKEVKSRRGEFALVGLPCQVHAIRKLQMDGPGWCSDKIKFIVGLFCGFSLRHEFMDYIFSNNNFKRMDVKEVHFRYRRHPNVSSLLITLKDGKRFFIDRRDYAVLFYLFAKEACLYCIDHTNEFADISVGDMRPFPLDSPNYRDIEPLQSVIVVRTEKGDDLLKSANDLDLTDFDIQDLIASKLTSMIDKKICSYTRRHLRQRKGILVPEFNQELMNDYALPLYRFKIRPSKAFTASRYLYEMSWLSVIDLMKRRCVTNILSKIPSRLLITVIRRCYIRFKTRGFLSSGNESGNTF